MNGELYRGYRITYNPKPIGDRRHDYDFAHVDYDGPEDRRAGSAASGEQARAAIDDIEAELEMERAGYAEATD